MSRPLLSGFLLLLSAGSVLADDNLIDSMDAIRFQSPKEKGRSELIEGKVGKAVRFTFDKDCQNTFFTSRLRGKPEWDQAAGLSFWVKGDGSDSFGNLHLIYDDDFTVRYDYCFSIKNREWTKVTVPWRDFIPVMPGAKSKYLGLPGGNAPSKVSAMWFGKWWYWRDYPAHSFAIDEIGLEPAIELNEPDYKPGDAPLERVLAKLKAGKPITIVTAGDSLTDTRH